MLNLEVIRRLINSVEDEVIFGIRLLEGKLTYNLKS